MPKKSQKNNYIEAVGKRKSAVARVRLYEDKSKAGEILVNKFPAHKTYHSDVFKSIYSKPLIITNTQGLFSVSVRIKGGGLRGQSEAISQGISKALLKIDNKKYRPLLKAEGLLRRDPRVKERRRVGTGGKARRKKQSPKR